MFFVAALVICLVIKFRFPKGKSIARIIEENKSLKCAAVNCRSGFSLTKKEKELMTKGITPSCKKHVFAFPKEEVTWRLWLSASNRTEMQIHLTRNILLLANFILKQKISKKITLHVLALLKYGCV